MTAPHPDALIDALQVRRNFQRRAEQTAGDSLASVLAGEVNRRMMERLVCIKLQPQRFLDAGCAQGSALTSLREHYPQALPLALDACLPALRQGRRELQAAGNVLSRLWPGVFRSKGPLWLCADFAQLPLSNASLELVWSNLALHWHSDPGVVFAEWQRVLKVQGLVMFSCFGPDTFRQLREALGADATRRLLPFIDMHDLGDQLVHQGFGDPVMDMEQLTLTYTSPEQLLQEVATLGGNPLLTRPRGLLSRQRYRHWQDQLRLRAAADGRIPLTIEVIYGHAWKPQPRQQRTPEGHVAVPIAQLRGLRDPSGGR